MADISDQDPLWGNLRQEAEGLGDEYQRGLSSLVPKTWGEAGEMAAYASPLGVPLSAKDTAQAAYNRDWLGAGLSAIGMIPVVGSIERAAIRPAEREAAKEAIRVYHGSPHDYAAERLVRHPTGETEYLVGKPGELPEVPQGATVLKDFPHGRARVDKVGTGEGAQLYGHGWYGAEEEAVGKQYKDQLAVPTVEGKPFDTQDPRHVASALLTDAKGNKADALARLRSDYNLADHFGTKYKQLLEQAKPILERGDPLPPVELKGHMYEANIDASPEHFLDHDQPLSSQSDAVREKLKPHIDEMREFYKNAGAHYIDPEKMTGAEFLRGLGEKPHEQMQALHDAGIPGVKYFDAGSRAAKEGSRNYVVFDDKLISIVRKYGIPGAISMGLITAEQGRQMEEQGLASGGTVHRADGGETVVPKNTTVTPQYDTAIPSLSDIFAQSTAPQPLSTWDKLSALFSEQPTGYQGMRPSTNVEDRRFDPPPYGNETRPFKTTVVPSKAHGGAISHKTRAMLVRLRRT